MKSQQPPKDSTHTFNSGDADSKATEKALDQLVTWADPSQADLISQVREAQYSTEELELEEDFGMASELNEMAAQLKEAAEEESSADAPENADPIDMSQLAAAVAAQTRLDEAELAPLVEAQKEEAAEELAHQIAEDLALKAFEIQEQSEGSRKLESASGNQENAEEVNQMDAVDPVLQAALPTLNETGQLDLIELQSCIEALLFMTDKPMAKARLKDLLAPELPESALAEFDQALALLTERYQRPEFGFEVVAVAGAYQLRTKPARAPLAKKLAKVQTQRLSSGGMETLAIVAYRQPVLKEEIDQIRGVDSSYFVRGLMDRKLIEITGRSELPGRPCLYSTTPHFLELLGVNALSDLPPLREIEQMIPTSTSGSAEDNPVVKQMRKLVQQMNSDTSVNLNYDPSEDETILQEIRARVQSIATSTPYLEEQKAAEKAAAEQAKAEAAQAALGDLQPPVQASEDSIITIESASAPLPPQENTGETSISASDL